MTMNYKCIVTGIVFTILWSQVAVGQPIDSDKVVPIPSIRSDPYQSQLTLDMLENELNEREDSHAFDGLVPTIMNETESSQLTLDMLENEFNDREEQELHEFDGLVPTIMNETEMTDIGEDPILLAGLFEGDIMTNVDPAIMARNMLPTEVWQGGVVPYMLDNSLTSRGRSAIRLAIEDFDKRTCIRFRPLQSGDINYVRFIKGNGCYSHVGKYTITRNQDVSIGSGCESKGTAIHEMMHALGFFHEQSRPDRDQYVTIIWNNIPEEYKNNFERARDSQTLETKYDYGSVMHYRNTAFGNGQITIQPKKAGAFIGNRKGFSDLDVQKINKLYAQQCTAPGVTEAPVTDAPVTEAPVRPTTCRDFYSNCPEYTAFCHNNQMRRGCKKTCGYCCVDQYTNCADFIDYCDSSQQMRLGCKKTCNNCFP